MNEFGNRKILKARVLARSVCLSGTLATQSALGERDGQTRKIQGRNGGMGIKGRYPAFQVRLRMEDIDIQWVCSSKTSSTTSKAQARILIKRLTCCNAPPARTKGDHTGDSNDTISQTLRFRSRPHQKLLENV